MGILNATADSFYDGGRYTTPDTIVAHARELLDQGADIIDLGVVSSRPGAALLPPQEEADRLAPLVSLLRNQLPPDTLILSTPAIASPQPKPSRPVPTLSTTSPAANSTLRCSPL